VNQKESKQNDIDGMKKATDSADVFVISCELSALDQDLINFLSYDRVVYILSKRPRDWRYGPIIHDVYAMARRRLWPTQAVRPRRCHDDCDTPGVPGNRSWAAVKLLKVCRLR